MLRSIAFWLAALIGSTAVAQAPAALEWNEIATGVLAADVGEPEAFGLLSVAGGTPRTDAIEKLPDVSLPFDATAVGGFANGRRASLRVPLAEDEEIYGLGLDFHEVRRRGAIQTLRVDHWGGTSGRTHAPVPFYVSSRGYGVFVDCARYMTFYVGATLRADSDRPPELRDRNRASNWQARPPSDSVEVHIPSAGARVYLFTGPTPLDVVRRFNLFSGGGCLPPKWGLGFTHRTPTRYTDEQIVAEVDEFRERGFPLDFIGVEPGWHSHAYPCSFEWDDERFPDPDRFLAALADRGVSANLWMNPYVCPDTPLHEKLLPFAASHHVWNGIIPDYEIAEAREIFGGHLDRVTIARGGGVGVGGFKIDEVDGYDRWLWPDTAIFPSSLDAEQIRQTYGVRIQRMIAERFRDRDRRTFGLVRASNAGAAPLPFVLYNDHYRHQDFITALVNSSFCGLLFTPEVRSSDSPDEWLRRMQTVCFSPMAMLNAWSSGTKPWSFPEVEAEVREIARMRMRLLPYLYTAFARYRDEGTPPMRAMPLVEGFAEAATAKERTAALKTQWVVGDCLLVAPLFAKESARDVVLPVGRWFDFHTGEAVGGGETIRVAPSDKRIPLFVRDGGIIPMTAALAHAPGPGDVIPLEILHFGTTASATTLYDDDGVSFAYERGASSWSRLEARRDDTGNWQGVVDTSDGPFSYAPVTWSFRTGDR